MALTLEQQEFVLFVQRTYVALMSFVFLLALFPYFQYLHLLQERNDLKWCENTLANESVVEVEITKLFQSRT